MKNLSPSRLFALATVAVLSAGVSLQAQAQSFSSLFILGDSLSDSGNNAIATGFSSGVPQAIPNDSYTPTLPYFPSATYSNGPVWATPFAAQLGLSAAPSLAGGGNVAFGGAETFVDGTLPGNFPPSLNTQLNMLLSATGGVLPSSGLYVVAGGGNNARAALASLGPSPTLAQVVSTVSQASAEFAIDIGSIVDRLQAAGARNIVVWNTPNLGAAPAVRAQGATAIGLGTLLAQSMNDALDYRLDSEVGVTTFDIFGLVGNVVANPSAYGMTNVTNACITGVCNAATNLFWDGIHPTAAGHEIIATAMVAAVAAVPEPGAVWLMMAGLVGVGAVLRRRAA